MTLGWLALICLVALVGPLLSLPRRVGIPVVLGELAVGLALGPTGTGWLHATDPTFSFLAEIGFALVMFTTGTHVPLRDPGIRTGALAGALRALGVGALAVGLAWGLELVFRTGHAWLYAVILASSSAALIMPSLARVNLATPALVSLAPQVALADAACIVLVPLAVDPAHAGRAALGALAVITAGGFAFIVLQALEGRGYRERVHYLSKRRGLALELRVVLVLLLAMAALASTLHVSVMLAGFVLGLVVAGVGEPRRLSHQVFALSEGFLGPIFFVWLGASLNLRTLAMHPTAIWLGLALGVAALIAHGALAVSKQPFPVAVLTAAEVGVPLAAATVGTQLHALAPGEDAALLLGALVTVATTAVAARSVEKRAEPVCADPHV